MERLKKKKEAMVHSEGWVYLCVHFLFTIIISLSETRISNWSKQKKKKKRKEYICVTLVINFIKFSTFLNTSEPKHIEIKEYKKKRDNTMFEWNYSCREGKILKEKY